MTDPIKMVRMSSYIQSMPKIELHCHLDGSVSPPALLAIARAGGKELPTHDAQELQQRMEAPGDCKSLVEYLTRFDFVLPFLQTGPALETAARELVRSAAAEGTIYIEVRFAPLLHTKGGLAPSRVVEHVCAGLAAGEAETGCMARSILIGMRHSPVQENLPLLKLAQSFRERGVVAVDIAGDEYHYPPALQSGFLREAARLGIPCTVHAGENGPPGNIAAAIELGAARIGHGTSLRGDPALLALARERGIPLEMCPTSNLQTKAVASWEDYPIREYFDAGLCVTVSTDNRTVSGTSLTREYAILAERFGFTRDMLARLVLNAAHGAFLPSEQKQELLERAGSLLERC